MKWIEKTYLQCIPLRFGVCLSFYYFWALLRLVQDPARSKWPAFTSSYERSNSLVFFLALLRNQRQTACAMFIYKSEENATVTIRNQYSDSD